MRKLTLVAVVAALLVAVAAPAPARTVPDWFWRWSAWMEHGQHGKRPVSAPTHVPRWAWRMLAADMRGLRPKRSAGTTTTATASAPTTTTTSPPKAAPTTTTSPAPTATTTTSAPPPTTTAASPAPPPPTTTTSAPAPTTTAAAPPPPTTTTTASPPPSSGLNASEQSLLDAVNQARAQNGLRPLAIDSRLEQAAQEHTADLLATNAFTHDFIKSGVSYPFATWIGWYYTGACAGENLAEGSPSLSAAQAVQLWLNSPGHRANMLSGSYTTIGVELSGSGGTTIATTDFGGC